VGTHAIYDTFYKLKLNLREYLSIVLLSQLNKTIVTNKPVMKLDAENADIIDTGLYMLMWLTAM